MSGSTIASSIDHSVTLGGTGYFSPLVITASGTINGSAPGAALYIPSGVSPAVVKNAGRILGGAGAVVGGTGYAGADGIAIATGAGVTNTGNIVGGAGGVGAANSAGTYNSGDGGIGVNITAGGVKLTNASVITGGAGGYVGYLYHGYSNHYYKTPNVGPVTGTASTPAAGGDGMDIAAGSQLRNTGQITGGAGGGANPNADGGFGGDGGNGVSDFSGRLINTGTIQGGGGGDGGAGLYITGAGAFGSNTGQIIGGGSTAEPGSANYGGYGVIVYNHASFQNSGTVSGGVGVAGALVTDATLINRGVIQAGPDNGGKGYDNMAQGIMFESGRLVNDGIILGGDVTTPGGYAGYGVMAFQGFTNAGQITGGNVGYGFGVHGGAAVLDVEGRIANSGTITGGQGGNVNGTSKGGAGGGGGGGVILEGGGGASTLSSILVNTGAIIGGNGGLDNHFMGGIGGTGVNAAADIAGDKTIINHGAITGGTGGTGGYYGGNGGAGGIAGGNAGPNGFIAMVTNTGAFTGGNGGAATGASHQRPPTGGVGGDGFFVSTGKFLNTGTVSGGNGGSSVSNKGGLGGAGMVATYGSSIVNHGVITAGAGGAGRYGGIGGEGVYLTNSTLINAGTISGGAGGIGTKTSGTAGAAVYLKSDSTLIIDPGAAFNGLVTAQAGSADTLELSGQSIAALTGIGTSFTGFATIGFADDAAWTISGLANGLDNGQAITGFTSADAIVLTNAKTANGTVTVATAGTVSIDAGGTIYALDIAGATVGETNFQFADYTLTEASGAMAFLAPAAAHTAAASQDLAALFASPARIEDFSTRLDAAFTLSAEMLPGSVHELVRQQRNLVPPTVTLHA
jgi:hypothetical protein